MRRLSRQGVLTFSPACLESQTGPAAVFETRTVAGTIRGGSPLSQDIEHIALPVSCAGIKVDLMLHGNDGFTQAFIPAMLWHCIAKI